MQKRWIRLWVDVLDDEKLAQLTHAQQRHYIWLLAMKGRGVLDGSQKARSARVQAFLGINAAECYALKRVLCRMQLIDRWWQPIGWNRRQYVGDEENQELTDRGQKRVKNGSKTWQKSVKNNDTNSLNSNGDDINPEKIGQKRVKNVSKTVTKPFFPGSDLIDSIEENTGHDSCSSDTDTDTEKNIGRVNTRQRVPMEHVADVLRHLNQLTGSRFTWRGPNGKPTKNAELVKQRLRDGYTPERLIAVIDRKARQWLRDDKMRLYLRPKTLFNPTNLENYEAEADG